MPKFLENALRHSGQKQGLKGKHLDKYIYGGMVNAGAMKNTGEETAKGAAMQAKHDKDVKAKSSKKTKRKGGVFF